MQNSNQGWETYSKLVLQQLETMAMVVQAAMAFAMAIALEIF